MPILVPPEHRVVDFDAFAGPTVTRVLLNARESRTLEEMRDTLLPNLISGEVRIPERDGDCEGAVVA